MKQLFSFVIILGMLLSCSKDKTTILVSSYGSSEDTCLRSFVLDERNGEVYDYAQLSGLVNPSYFIISSTGRTIYAVSERDELNSGVYVIRQTSNELEQIDFKSCNAGPCYISVDPTQRFAVTANYEAGSMSILYIHPLNAMLQQGEKSFAYTGHGPVAGRQDQSHVHCISWTPDHQYVIATDLGTDQLHMYPLREKGNDKLLYHLERKDIDLTPGSGPRHMVWGRNNKAYLINEISGTIVVWDYQDGKLTAIQEVVCDSLGAHGSGDIQLSPDGQCLYATNRLQGDGIAIYKVDSLSGMVRQVGYQPTGKHPRSIMITQSGRYLLCACKDENCVEIYRRDAQTGLLQKSEQRIEMPCPVCVKECRVKVIHHSWFHI